MKSSRNDSQVRFLSKELVTSPSVGNNQPLLKEVSHRLPSPLKKERKSRQSILISAKTSKLLFSIEESKASRFTSAVFGNIHDFIEQNVYTSSTVILHSNFHLLIWAGSGFFFFLPLFLFTYLINQHKNPLNTIWNYNETISRNIFVYSSFKLAVENKNQSNHNSLS